jgi:hypothetical protein
MSLPQTRILGFDARETWLKSEEVWNENRKSQYLIRLDVTKPLSVDPIVWQPVFDFFPDLRPGFVGPFLNFWQNLGDLKTCVTTKPELKNKQFDIIACSLVLDTCSENELVEWDTRLRGIYPDGTPGNSEPTDPNEPSDTWKSIGYDIADGACISGLSNCGFSSGSADLSLKKRWARHLSKIHLFNDLSQANDYKTFTNERVPEHAPFFVYQLWLCSTRY